MEKPEMAKVGEIKVPKRTVRQHNPLFLDERYTGTEPKWDHDRAATFDSETFDHFLRKSLNYYNHFYNTKGTRKHLIEWLRRSNTLDKKTLDQYVKTADKHTPMTACSLAMANRAGMPLKDRHIEFIIECVNQAIALSIDDDPEDAPLQDKIAVPVMTIQERLNEKLSEFIGELEGRFDEVILNQATNGKVFEFLKTENVPGALVTKIRNHFQDRSDQLTVIQASTDPDHKESYKHYKAADWRRIQTWLASLMTDCDSYGQVKKAVRKTRTPKSLSKDKIVAKLKYQVEDKVLKLVSIKPVEIIGATELWCYDTKTRKLGRYIADSHAGSLSVKGTSIIGFDTVTSVSKTLRKPAEQLKLFIKATKPQLRKFMDSVTTTETKLSGRINDQVLLLKVV